MMLAPEVQAHVDAEEPAPPGDGIDALRRHVSRQLDRHFLAFGLQAPAPGPTHEHRVPVDGTTVRVRMYEPPDSVAATTADRPVHVTLHGGAWSMCSIDDFVSDATARHRAALGVVVIGIEYRLAPEHPYPAAVRDVLAVLDWIARRSRTLRVSPRDITVGGSSAGATIALSAALAGANRHRLSGLLLEVPALDLTGETAGAELRRSDYREVADDFRERLDAYLPDQRSRRDPIASPYFAPDLTRLPPTAILTAEHDPLHVEAAYYADRLRAVGRLIEHRCYPGAMHGSAILAGVWGTARRWHDDTLRLLRTMHGLPAAGGGSSEVERRD